MGSEDITIAPECHRAPVVFRVRAAAGSKRRRELLLVWIFLLPSLAVFFLYRILPLIWNLVLSFQEFSLFGVTRFIGFNHYVDMWHDEVFWISLKNTLIYMASAPVGIALALAVSLMVNSEVRGRNVLPHHRVPVLPVDDGRGWHHLALALR